MKRGRPGQDEAIIALLIGAMNANGHVSAAEAARAHHIIWSMRRFRRRSGEAVGRTIENARTLIEEQGAWPTVEASARRIPARLRPAMFAVAADLVLADGTLDPAERTFLDRLAGSLRLDRRQARRVVQIMLVKNSV